jgi:hypothetical protein
MPASVPRSFRRGRHPRRIRQRLNMRRVFVATLTPGQSVTLSTPRMLGQLAVEVRFMRRGDELVVDDGAKLPRSRADRDRSFVLRRLTH